MTDSLLVEVDTLLAENQQLKNTILGLEQRCEDYQIANSQKHDTEKINRAWIESSPVCTKIVDLDYKLQYMSAAGIQGLCIEDINEFYNKPYPFDFYPEDFNQQMLSTLDRAKGSALVQDQEGKVVDIRGNELWFHSTIVPVKDESDKLDYFVIVSIDITDRKQAEERLLQLNSELEERVIERTKALQEANQQLKQLSETDALTKIANRRVYTIRLNEEVARMHRSGQSLSLLVIDIDYFKQYNDSYGHKFGDTVLTRVANVIRDSLPRSSDFLARIGGEEFAVILSSTDTERAADVAEKIRHNLQAEGFKHSSQNASLTVSIGISSQNSKDTTDDLMFYQADKALFVAKALGRNRVEIFEA